jgi:hypothetical protein
MINENAKRFKEVGNTGGVIPYLCTPCAEVLNVFTGLASYELRYRNENT